MPTWCDADDPRLINFKDTPFHRWVQRHIYKVPSRDLASIRIGNLHAVANKLEVELAATKRALIAEQASRERLRASAIIAEEYGRHLADWIVAAYGEDTAAEARDFAKVNTDRIPTT